MMSKKIKPVVLVTYLSLFLLSHLSCKSEPEVKMILPGAYQTENYLHVLEGKNVGLVVNYASKIADVHLLDTLSRLGVKIVKVFSPEHGFSGKYDAGTELESDSSFNNKDVEFVSLYGSNRKPGNQQLEGIDIMVFDLQDVGVRFYTYIYTLHYVMEACAQNSLPVIVFDRPNPNGHYVDGPVLKPNCKSFIGMHPVPIVYGLTIGEYGQMINGELWLEDSIQCELNIIKCDNYSHESYYDVPDAPSPNLPDMRSIYLYPSTGLFEGTIVSEGRGTRAPFQFIGHPEYSDKSISFTPKSIKGASMNPKLLGKECFGIDLSTLSTDSLINTKNINLDYLLKFYNDMQMGENFFIDYIDLLSGTDEFSKQVVNGLNAKEIQDSWQVELNEYKKVREKYLLYPDFQ